MVLLIWPLRMLGMIVAQAGRAGASAQRVHEILATEADVVDPPRPVRLPAGGGLVRFDGVGFGYRGGRPVLDGFDLTVDPGESVALVGATGSGKSTVAKLHPPLLRRRRRRGARSTASTCGPSSVRELRRAVGLVFEETFLFSDSIAANIAFADPDAPIEAIERAARLAGAHEFVLQLPEGYGTEIGERGYSLSGGQRQRIAIARAILADPRVLILDDATSAVDPDQGARDPRRAHRGDARPHDDRHRPPAGHHRPGRPGGADRRRPGRRRPAPTPSCWRRAPATARCWRPPSSAKPS